MGEIIIRPYRASDQQAVRQIAYDTAFLGGSATAFFDGQEFLADVLTGAFLDYEPQSCFVAENKGEVIGYLLGSKDLPVLEKAAAGRMIFKLSFQLIFKGLIFKAKNFIFLLNLSRSFFRGEFKAPDFSRDYPACLHINIKEEFRSQGIGSRLMQTFTDYLISQKIRGVHFATFSERAARFYKKLGFHLLHESRRTYFRHILAEEVVCYIYGKKLD